MLMGQSDGLSAWGSSKSLLLSDPVAEMDESEFADDESEKMSDVLHIISFEELKTKIIAYDTIIWLWISLLLVLAWGIGVLMLLYLPFKRYVLRKDIASRKLYVTSDEIIYKVPRPSYIPFYREIKIQKRVPLHLVIDVILEQGCLQSIYGIHTLRVESISDGKAASVDELQLQGVYNPQRLRKVIVAQAAKVIKEVNARNGEGESLFRTESLTEAWLRSPSKSSAWREKFQLRFKGLEGKLISSPNCSAQSSNICNGVSSKKTKLPIKPYQRSGSSAILDKLNSSFNSRSRSLDAESSRTYDNDLANGIVDSNGTLTANVNGCKMENEDYVSGTLYDVLQKEVIILRKACQDKDHNLKDKDDAIEMLAKKDETLNKAMEVESKKKRREMAALEKEITAVHIGKDQDQRLKRAGSERFANGAHPPILR